MIELRCCILSYGRVCERRTVGVITVTRIGISICAMLALLSCAKRVMPTQTLSPAQALRKACEDGSSRACYEQGMMFLKTDLVSDRRARRALRRSCELQYGRGCFQLAQLVGSEARSKSARLRSTRLYGKACNLGWSRGCHKVAIEAFIRSKTRNEMVKATDALARLCDEADVTACMDYLRGRLALGMPTPDPLRLQMRSLCTQSAQSLGSNLTDCQRIFQDRCNGPESQSCEDTSIGAQIVQDAVCPKHDQEWVVSVVHVAMLECRAGFAGTLTLQFDPNGRQSTPRVTKTVSECVDRWIKSIEIMPLKTARNCSLKLQF